MTRMTLTALLLCLALAPIARSEPLPDELLVAKPSFTSPTLSPDGSRMAMVADTGKGERALVIFQVSGLSFKPLIKTGAYGLTGVSEYEWMSNNVLLVWVETGGVDPPFWTALNVDKGVMVPMEHEFAHLIKANWGDPQHALIYDPCTLSYFCLYSWNVVTNTGLPYGAPLSFSQSPIFSFENDKVIATVTDASADSSRLTWDNKADKWVPAPPKAAIDAQAGASEQDFRLAESRYQGLVAHGIAGRQVTTSGTHHLVGISVPAPGPAFMALHHALEGPSTAVSAAFPGRRVYWTSVSDDLNHAVLTINALGAPPTYYLWDRSAGLAPVVRSYPALDDNRLGPMRAETDWFEDRTPVVIVAPPAGTPSVGAVLRVEMMDSEFRDALVRFDGDDAVLTQHGVTVVRVPVQQPNDVVFGSVWRRRVSERLAVAENRAVQEHLEGSGSVCIAGSFFNGYVALAAAAQSQKYACVIATNVPFGTDALTQPVATEGLLTFGGTIRTSWSFGGEMQRRWKAMTAQDGDSPLAHGDPTEWSGQLPARVLLAYGMTSGSLGAGLKLQSNAFQDAMRKSGKPVMLYVPSKNFDDPAKWDAAFDEATLEFMRH